MLHVSQGPGVSKTARTSWLCGGKGEGVAEKPSEGQEGKPETGKKPMPSCVGEAKRGGQHGAGCVQA